MKSRPKGLDSPLATRFIKRMASVNVAVYRRSGGRLGGSMGGAPVLLLEHRGRKTGQLRTTPLVYLVDGDRIVVVASQAGRVDDPQWYLNLQAHPDVAVQLGSERREVHARTAAAGERTELWPRLVATYADYENYQSWCPREIPVVILDPR